jgi:hypothetical protein
MPKKLSIAEKTALPSAYLKEVAFDVIAKLPLEVAALPCYNNSSEKPLRRYLSQCRYVLYVHRDETLVHVKSIQMNATY